MHSIQQLYEMKEAAALRIEFDVLIRNVSIVNVFTQEIVAGHLGIKHGKIVSFQEGKAKRIVEGNGRYASPLFMDPHVHLESMLLAPHLISEMVLPKGVGTLVADPHELVNACGLAGLDYLLHACEPLKTRIYINLPSCIPSTPYETAYEPVTAAMLSPYYNHPNVLGLAEVMSYEAVLNEQDMLQKLYDARLHNKAIDGHGSVLDATGLDVYATCGIRNDHECEDVQGMIERMRRGITTFIREGTVAKNLKQLLPALTAQNYRFACFCTDDRHPDDIMQEGGLDYLVNQAIDQGLDPIQAITMASYNVAQHYHLKEVGALAPGFAADFFLFERLDEIVAQEVFVQGELVANAGVMLEAEPALSLDAYPAVMDSMNLLPISALDLQISVPSGLANVMHCSYGSLVTTHKVESVATDAAHQFVFDASRDVAKLIVVERHHASGNVGKALVSGFHIKAGCIATSVAHDSHNIIALGTNDADILLAVETLKEAKGGYVVVHNGVVEALLPLAIGGIMSLASREELLDQLHRLHRKALTLIGREEFNPFMMLSFMALPVIPHLKITDQGLFDVYKQTFVEVGVSLSS